MEEKPQSVEVRLCEAKRQLHSWRQFVEDVDESKSESKVDDSKEETRQGDNSRSTRARNSLELLGEDKKGVSWLPQVTSRLRSSSSASTSPRRKGSFEAGSTCCDSSRADDYTPDGSSGENCITADSFFPSVISSSEHAFSNGPARHDMQRASPQLSVHHYSASIQRTVLSDHQQDRERSNIIGSGAAYFVDAAAAAGFTSCNNPAFGKSNTRMFNTELQNGTSYTQYGQEKPPAEDTLRSFKSGMQQTESSSVQSSFRSSGNRSSTEPTELRRDSFAILQTQRQQQQSQAFQESHSSVLGEVSQPDLIISKSRAAAAFAAQKNGGVVSIEKTETLSTAVRTKKNSESMALRCSAKLKEKPSNLEGEQYRLKQLRELTLDLLIAVSVLRPFGRLPLSLQGRLQKGQDAYSTKKGRYWQQDHHQQERVAEATESARAKDSPMPVLKRDSCNVSTQTSNREEEISLLGRRIAAAVCFCAKGAGNFDAARHLLLAGHSGEQQNSRSTTDSSRFLSAEGTSHSSSAGPAVTADAEREELEGRADAAAATAAVAAIAARNQYFLPYEALGEAVQKIQTSEELARFLCGCFWPLLEVLELHMARARSRRSATAGNNLVSTYSGNSNDLLIDTLGCASSSSLSSSGTRRGDIGNSENYSSIEGTSSGTNKGDTFSNIFSDSGNNVSVTNIGDDGLQRHVQTNDALKGVNAVLHVLTEMDVADADAALDSVCDAIATLQNLRPHADERSSANVVLSNSQRVSTELQQQEQLQQRRQLLEGLLEHQQQQHWGQQGQLFNQRQQQSDQDKQQQQLEAAEDEERLPVERFQQRELKTVEDPLIDVHLVRGWRDSEATVQGGKMISSGDSGVGMVRGLRSSQRDERALEESLQKQKPLVSAQHCFSSFSRREEADRRSAQFRCEGRATTAATTCCLTTTEAQIRKEHEKAGLVLGSMRSRRSSNGSDAEVEHGQCRRGREAVHYQVIQQQKDEPPRKQYTQTMTEGKHTRGSLYSDEESVSNRLLWLALHLSFPLEELGGKPASTATSSAFSTDDVVAADTDEKNSADSFPTAVDRIGAALTAAEDPIAAALKGGDVAVGMSARENTTAACNCCNGVAAAPGGKGYVSADVDAAGMWDLAEATVTTVSSGAAIPPRAILSPGAAVPSSPTKGISDVSSRLWLRKSSPQSYHASTSSNKRKQFSAFERETARDNSPQQHLQQHKQQRVNGACFSERHHAEMSQSVNETSSSVIMKVRGEGSKAQDLSWDSSPYLVKTETGCNSSNWESSSAAAAAARKPEALSLLIEQGLLAFHKDASTWTLLDLLTRVNDQTGQFSTSRQKSPAAIAEELPVAAAVGKGGVLAASKGSSKAAAALEETLAASFRRLAAREIGAYAGGYLRQFSKLEHADAERNDNEGLHEDGAAAAEAERSRAEKAILSKYALEGIDSVVSQLMELAQQRAEQVRVQEHYREHLVQLLQCLQLHGQSQQKLNQVEQELLLPQVISGEEKQLLQDGETAVQGARVEREDGIITAGGTEGRGDAAATAPYEDKEIIPSFSGKQGFSSTTESMKFSPELKDAGVERVAEPVQAKRMRVSGNETSPPTPQRKEGALCHRELPSSMMSSPVTAEKEGSCSDVANRAASSASDSGDMRPMSEPDSATTMSSHTTLSPTAEPSVSASAPHSFKRLPSAAASRTSRMCSNFRELADACKLAAFVAGSPECARWRSSPLEASLEADRTSASTTSPLDAAASLSSLAPSPFSPVPCSPGSLLRSPFHHQPLDVSAGSVSIAAVTKTEEETAETGGAAAAETGGPAAAETGGPAGIPAAKTAAVASPFFHDEEDLVLLARAELPPESPDREEARKLYLPHTSSAVLKSELDELRNRLDGAGAGADAALARGNSRFFYEGSPFFLGAATCSAQLLSSLRSAAISSSSQNSGKGGISASLAVCRPRQQLVHGLFEEESQKLVDQQKKQTTTASHMGEKPTSCVVQKSSPSAQLRTAGSAAGFAQATPTTPPRGQLLSSAALAGEFASAVAGINGSWVSEPQQQPEQQQQPRSPRKLLMEALATREKRVVTPAAASASAALLPQQHHNNTATLSLGCGVESVSSAAAAAGRGKSIKAVCKQTSDNPPTSKQAQSPLSFPLSYFSQPPPPWSRSSVAALPSQEESGGGGHIRTLLQTRRRSNNAELQQQYCAAVAAAEAELGSGHTRSRTTAGNSSSTMRSSQGKQQQQLQQQTEYSGSSSSRDLLREILFSTAAHPVNEALRFNGKQDSAAAIIAEIRKLSSRERPVAAGAVSERERVSPAAGAAGRQTPAVRSPTAATTLPPSSSSLLFASANRLPLVRRGEAVVGCMGTGGGDCLCGGNMCLYRSAVSGVVYDKSGQKWTARWNEDSRQHKRTFAAAKYGFLNAKLRAEACRGEARERTTRAKRQAMQPLLRHQPLPLQQLHAQQRPQRQQVHPARRSNSGSNSITRSESLEHQK